MTDVYIRKCPMCGGEMIYDDLQEWDGEEVITCIDCGFELPLD